MVLSSIKLFFFNLISFAKISYIFAIDFALPCPFIDGISDT